MEQNVQGLGNKLLQMAKIALFMLKKGICKKKILLELNLIVKRGKFARKSFRNLTTTDHHFAAAAAKAGEYEFSCSDTPLHRRYFAAGQSKRKTQKHYEDDTISRVLEIVMMTSATSDVEASPVLPGFEHSPMGSPFSNLDNPDEGSRVDQAAEDFINMFYSQLKKQKYNY